MPDDARAEEQAALSPAKAGDESTLTVLIALGANCLIAIAKSVVAFITGSASMVAEAAHSWADTGNEIFLLVAERTSDREPDETHPFGYGREAYVWSMFAAFGLFTAGSVVAIWHGIQSWSHPEPDTSYGWAYAVLALAFVLEGTSFLQARRQTHEAARKSGLHPLRYLALTSNPTLRAVFAEDAAALVGVLFAAGGIGMHELTGDARWDSVGSILVGLLLGVIAVYLIDRNRDFLVGQAVSPPVRRRALQALLEDHDVEKVTFLHLEFVGPGKVLLIAATDITGDQPETQVAGRLQAIAERIEAHELVEKAFITLSAPGDTPLTVD
ncbi:cation diffusion facilitator family transporter [Intrasporangium chromatireducens Q5-1]|uniref:Cation diffusion facilitator family transporter n=1 Tax=Intrasporangium chromatireducens Q5-1 TaxID=584657 RepID=W9GLI4_9MICO|nr:cation diffusion facilitator family transporter [Intrasporangium chromatireducens]EWT05683.1 cation diffusion facilitator family transporter [Intrasporangium chromatireducens Q5-1]